MDELNPVSTDYTESLPGSTGDVFVVGLGDPTTTPAYDVNHIIRVCGSKNASGGANVGFLCELRQSYVSETDLGTIIASFVCAELPSTVDTFYRYRLPTTEAGLITDYTALSLRFVSTNARGGAPRSCRLHWAEVEVPTNSETNESTGLSREEFRRKLVGISINQESDRRTTGSTSRI